jgi:hypothetical protein
MELPSHIYDALNYFFVMAVFSKDHISARITYMVFV